MVVNFRAPEISQDTRKLIRTPTLNKKNIKYVAITFGICFMAQETVSELADKYIIHRLTVSSTARSQG